MDASGSVLGPSGDVPFAPDDDPWQPVWSGALFMAIMLAIGCVYMERMEF